MSSSEDKLNDLMTVYKSYENAKSAPPQENGNPTSQEDGTELEKVLTEAYRQYTCSAPNSNLSTDDKAVLEEALSFCKQQKNSVKVMRVDGSPASQADKPSRESPLFKPVLCDDTGKQNYNLEAEKEVRELSIKDKSPTPEIMIQNAARISHPVIRPPKGEITMVETEGKTYTRIGPPAVDINQGFAPSRHSAFRLAMPLDGKRLRLDPGMQYLQVDSNKSKLSRSTSVPVYPEGEENTPPHHRVLYRTGSFVSNLTKQKLKNSILARTSAALVRKPSITDQEMRQIRYRDDSDSDSSQSEDEDFAVEPVLARKRKYSEEEKPVVQLPVITSTLPTVITTSGPT